MQLFSAPHPTVGGFLPYWQTGSMLQVTERDKAAFYCYKQSSFTLLLSNLASYNLVHFYLEEGEGGGFHRTCSLASFVSQYGDPQREAGLHFHTLVVYHKALLWVSGDMKTNVLSRE